MPRSTVAPCDVFLCLNTDTSMFADFEALLCRNKHCDGECQTAVTIDRRNRTTAIAFCMCDVPGLGKIRLAEGQRCSGWFRFSLHLNSPCDHEESRVTYNNTDNGFPSIVDSNRPKHTHPYTHAHTRHVYLDT